MKNKLLLLIFILSLVFGVYFGAKYNGRTDVGSSVGNNGNRVIINDTSPTAIPWQENFIIVAVDTISSQAYVNSIWLLMIDKDTSDRSMVSIYPQNSGDKYSEAHQPIILNANDIESIINLDVITSQKLLMNHIVVVDETFVNLLVSMSGGVAIEGVSYSTFSEIIDSALPWKNPQGSLSNQLAVLTSICGMDYDINVQDLFAGASIPEHVVTTTSLSDLNARWNVMVLTGSGNNCEIFIGN